MEIDKERGREKEKEEKKERERDVRDELTKGPGLSGRGATRRRGERKKVKERAEMVWLKESTLHFGMLDTTAEMRRKT